MSEAEQNIKLRLCGVKKSFGSNKVLQGVDLEIPKGKSLVVIGGSGTGKSLHSLVYRNHWWHSRLLTCNLCLGFG